MKHKIYNRQCFCFIKIYTELCGLVSSHDRNLSVSASLIYWRYYYYYFFTLGIYVPEEISKLEIQNESRYYDQSVRSAAGRQSCNKMALKRCTKTANSLKKESSALWPRQKCWWSSCRGRLGEGGPRNWGRQELLLLLLLLLLKYTDYNDSVANVARALYTVRKVLQEREWWLSRLRDRQSLNVTQKNVIEFSSEGNQWRCSSDGWQ